MRLRFIILFVSVCHHHGSGAGRGRPWRMRCEKSGALSAACARSLISEIFSNSANGIEVSIRPLSYRYAGTYPLRRIFHESGGDSGFIFVCVRMLVVQVVVSVLYM